MPPQRALVGLDHVALLARSLEPTVQFYVDVLGLHIIDLTPGTAQPASARVCLGADGHRFITITEAPDGQLGAMGIGTIHHVALSVEGRDALLKWKRWLQHHYHFLADSHRHLLLRGPGPPLGAEDDRQ